jgi:hypothetical protein
VPLSKLTRSQEQTIETAALDAYIAYLAFWEAINGPLTVVPWEKMTPDQQESWRVIAKTVLLSTQGPIYRHQVRDELVEVLGTAKGQVSTGSAALERPDAPNARAMRTVQDDTEVLVYRGHGGQLYFRFPDEFADGRFVPVVG